MKCQILNKDFLPVVLAAGFGKRLGVMTESLPKALVPVGAGRLIDCALWQISKLGFKEVVINLHYKGNLIKEYLGRRDLGLKIHYSEEVQILDTGGAIKKIFHDYTPDNLLIINCDSIFGIDLVGQIDSWARAFPTTTAVASLLVKANDSDAFSKLGFSKGALTSINDPKPNEELVTFLGLQLVSCKIIPKLKLLPDIFGTFDKLYPSLLAGGLKITSQIYTGDWWDAGTPERLEAVNKAVLSGKVALL